MQNVNVNDIYIRDETVVVKAMQAGGDGCINLAQATEILGVNRKTVLKLACIGLLGKRARTASRLRSPILLTRTDAEDLIQRLERQRIGKARKTRYSAASCQYIRGSNGKVARCCLTYLIESVARGSCVIGANQTLHCSGTSKKRTSTPLVARTSSRFRKRLE